jgi:hypothetical protein
VVISEEIPSERSSAHARLCILLLTPHSGDAASPEPASSMLAAAADPSVVATSPAPDSSMVVFAAPYSPPSVNADAAATPSVDSAAFVTPTVPLNPPSVYPADVFLAWTTTAFAADDRVKLGIFFNFMCLHDGVVIFSKP